MRLRAFAGVSLAALLPAIPALTPAAEKPADGPPPGIVQRTLDPAPANGPAVRVAGVVVSAGKHPLPGAQVVLRAKIGGRQYSFGVKHNRDVLARTTTDAGGRFSFDGIPIPPRLDEVIANLLDGTAGAELVAWADGWGVAWTDLAQLASADEVRLTLQREAPVSGIVQDTAGHGVAGVRVAVGGATPATGDLDPVLREPGDLNLSLSELNFEAVTDAEGRFTLRHAQPGIRWLISAERAGYRREFFLLDTDPESDLTEMRFQVGGGTVVPVKRSPLTITIKPARVVEVRVLDHQGRPMESGAVEAITAEGDFAGWEQVDAQGVTRMAIAKAGRYEFAYQRDPLEPGLGTSVTADVPEGPIPSPIEIRLPEARWLAGQVTDEDGRGIVGAYLLYAAGKDGASLERWDLHAMAVSGADGRFRIPVAKGPGTLSFFHTIFGYLPPCFELWSGRQEAMPETAIDIAETGDPAPVQLRVSRGLAVRGIVRDAAGQPLAGVVVRGENTDRPFRRTDTSTDAQGCFELAGLSPHVPANLIATTLSGAARRTIPAEPDHPWDRTRRVDDVELVVQPGHALAGRVLHGDRPLAGVRMRLHGTWGGERRRYTVFGEVATDAEGRYRVGALAVGDEYYFEILAPNAMTAPGWGHQMDYIQEIREGSPPVIELPDAVLVTCGQTLRGRVVDPQGRPVAGITVSAHLADGESLSRQATGPPPWIKTDERGRFELRRLPDQPIELLAYRANPRGGVIRFMSKVRPALNQRDIRIMFDPTLTEDIEDLDATPAPAPKHAP